MTLISVLLLYLHCTKLKKLFQEKRLVLQRKVEKGKQQNFVHLPGRTALEGQFWTVSGVDLVQMPLIRTQLLLSSADQHFVVFHFLHKARLASIALFTRNLAL